jgi:predicted TPR repeat methyltransferase
VSYSNESIRQLERASLRSFLQRIGQKYLRGRVLDFGAGTAATCQKPQPYKDLVSGEYLPYDVGDDELPAGPYDAILCTQVLQYLEDPEGVLTSFRMWLEPKGHLVMTYPTNWPEVEPSDLRRFTKAGVEKMLASIGFEVIAHERRGVISLNGFELALGYGVVARTI